MKRIGIIVAGAVLLAACQDEASEVATSDEAQTAEGEVLGGTISDDMLPLATSTSQPPALRQQSSNDSSTPSSGSPPAEPEEESDEEAPAAEPAEPAGDAPAADADGEES
ncbi:hypothetical protein GRI34_00560 [Erythrobacter aquimaris]|uniref:Lipoprotein n=1 Tax=Qipengyuania aquimaris TaxID=255984 RepID=A0A6I4TIC8_9SPHN|nr:hypothetical protein [Qipengyuania aquimaris]MXO94907.1 hypothetical protein [Qipengyuania aquimaris]